MVMTLYAKVSRVCLCVCVLRLFPPTLLASHIVSQVEHSRNLEHRVNIHRPGLYTKATIISTVKIIGRADVISTETSFSLLILS